MQDLIHQIPTRKFTLPAWTGWFRYVLLIVFVFGVPYFFGEEHPLFFCRLCPAGAMEAALPNMARMAVAGKAIVWPTATKMMILGLILLPCSLRGGLGVRCFALWGRSTACSIRFLLFFLRFQQGSLQGLRTLPKPVPRLRAPRAARR